MSSGFGSLTADLVVPMALAEQGAYIPDDQIQGGNVKQREHGGGQKPEAYADRHGDEKLGLETALQQQGPAVAIHKTLLGLMLLHGQVRQTPIMAQGS